MDEPADRNQAAADLRKNLHLAYDILGAGIAAWSHLMTDLFDVSKTATMTVIENTANQSTPTPLASILQTTLAGTSNATTNPLRAFLSAVNHSYRRRAADIVEDLLHSPILSNYRGYISAWLSTDEGSTVIKPSANSPALLIVQMSLGLPSDILVEPVLITDGDDLPLAEFHICVESDTVIFPNRQERLIRQTHSGSPPARATFPFRAPATAGQHHIWIQAFQHNRLIQSLRLVLDVSKRASRRGHS